MDSMIEIFPSKINSSKHIKDLLKIYDAEKIINEKIDLYVNYQITGTEFKQALDQIFKRKQFSKITLKTRKLMVKRVQDMQFLDFSRRQEKRKDRIRESLPFSVDYDFYEVDFKIYPCFSLDFFDEYDSRGKLIQPLPGLSIIDKLSLFLMKFFKSC
jgi:hypothetical protein